MRKVAENKAKMGKSEKIRAKISFPVLEPVNSFFLHCFSYIDISYAPEAINRTNDPLRCQTVAERSVTGKTKLVPRESRAEPDTRP